MFFQYRHMYDRPASFGRLLAAALLLLLTVIGSAAGYCRQGNEWFEYNDNCYLWRKDLQNWFRAELNCMQFGGHLVSIPTQSDIYFLQRLTQCSDFWIGMVNTNPSARDDFRSYEWWDGASHNFTTLNTRTWEHANCVFFNIAGNWYNNVFQGSNSYVCKAPAATQGNLLGQPLSGHKEARIFLGANAGFRDPTSIMWPQNPAEPFKCPAGWLLMDRSCYFVSDNKTNYFNAQMSCQALGASVASVLTPREHTLLTVALGCRAEYVWIGLEKAKPCFKQPNQDHCWVWMDGNPVDYFEWAPKQELDKPDSECVALRGQWWVTNCYNEVRYVCKKAAI